MRSMVMTTLAVLAGSGAVATAADIQVLYSEAPGHPTAVVPGTLDANGDPIVAEWKAMELLAVSADGSTWIVKGRSHLDAELDTMLIIGDANGGTMLAQENRPIPGGASGEVYDFFGSGRARFNQVGQYCYTARARGGDPSVKQKGIMFDGKGLVLVRAESDPALGLEDNPPENSGDELFGNSFGSMHLLNDGTIGYQDGTIQNIHSSRRPAVFYNDTAFLQANVSGYGESGVGVWESFDSNDFRTTPDGETWMAQGDDTGDSDADDILVVNGGVVIREGSSLPTSEIIVDGIFQADLVHNGDWFCRGDDPSDGDWAVKNGQVIAATGFPIISGEAEAWGASIVACTGNGSGDYVVAGKTDASEATNEVVVLNGSVILAREGDPVDLDGNGKFDDDAFIGRGNLTSNAIQPDDVFITDDGVVWMLASLRDGEGNDLGEFGTGGDALLRIVPVSACDGDLDGDRMVGVTDLLLLLGAWGDCDVPCPPGCEADLDADCSVGVTDLLLLLGSWGDC